MRTEKEMYDLIINYAMNDERIKYVFLNGSRANEKVIKDKYQDFDIVYFVDDINSFINNKNWIDYFGERVIMQIPQNENCYTYLMQFMDGNRIDLTLMELKYLDDYLQEDSLTILLYDRYHYDKDNNLPSLKKASEQSYFVTKPTIEEFLECSNEFYWVSLYVVKGLKRNELFYAAECLNLYLRNEYHKMISWNVGLNYDFKVNVGKGLKFINKYLDEEMINEMKSTYFNLDYMSIYNSLLIMVYSFRKLYHEVAEKLDYKINKEEEIKVISYILKIMEEENV